MGARQKFIPEPRLFDREQAAAYCGVSGEVFERSCPIAPKRFGTRRKLWDRQAIDKWLDESQTEGQPQRSNKDYLRLLDADAS